MECLIELTLSSHHTKSIQVKENAQQEHKLISNIKSSALAVIGSNIVNYFK